MCLCAAIVVTVDLYFFFFQAEDGIRDDLVTGVQTCALPILPDSCAAMARSARGSLSAAHESGSEWCCRSLEEVHAAYGSGSCLSHAQERVGDRKSVV